MWTSAKINAVFAEVLSKDFLLTYFPYSAPPSALFKLIFETQTVTLKWQRCFLK